VGTQRQKYIELVSDVEDLVSALEAAPSDRISASAAAASARVFEAAAEIGTVRGEAAHYQAEAEELFVELQDYKCCLQQERGRVEYFQRCAIWEAGARVAAEHRAQAAEAAAAAERAAHQLTRQQLKQVRPLYCACACTWLPGCLRHSLFTHANHPIQSHPLPPSKLTSAASPPFSSYPRRHSTRPRPAPVPPPSPLPSQPLRQRQPRTAILNRCAARSLASAG
jgi:hypothetical protein